MSYGTFIGELKKGIEGQITAYDSKPMHDGCIIYLKKSGERIFVQATVIDHHRSDAIALLRAKIREGLGSTSRLVLGIQNDELKFWEDSASDAGTVVDSLVGSAA
ncbi:MAG: hypothetical protein ITG07_11510 [Candidimonas sp.]|nr:hypothetical protein [Candidimonas sp.]